MSDVLSKNSKSINGTGLPARKTGQGVHAGRIAEQIN